MVASKQGPALFPCGYSGDLGFAQQRADLLVTIGDNANSLAVAALLIGKSSDAIHRVTQPFDPVKPQQRGREWVLPCFKDTGTLLVLLSICIDLVVHALTCLSISNTFQQFLALLVHYHLAPLQSSFENILIVCVQWH